MSAFQLFDPPAWNFIQPIRNVMPIRFRVLIDGEPSGTRKHIRIARGPGISERATALLTGGNEYTPDILLYDRLWLERISWLVTVEDLDAQPPIYQGFILPITEAGTYTLNIWTGAGGGAQGDPAAVTGFVRVDGVPDARDVVALERTDSGEWRIAGFSHLDDTGQIELRTLGGRIYGLAVDDYGIGFLPGLPVTAGQRIRPARFRGWLYEITEPGMLPAAEPQWWPIEGENPSRQLGTARAVAVRYYLPQTYGPVPVEML